MKKDELLNYFHGNIRNAIFRISEVFWNDIHEIRLKANRPLTIWTGNKLLYVTLDGQLTYNSKSAIIISEQELNHIFEAICLYSIHSYRREITEGFITVKGGHRVGLCGTAIVNNNVIENIKNISSLNFRIAREIVGCADFLYEKKFTNNLCNLLIAGVPSSGKTTMLRDLTRKLSSKYKVSVIDERGEIASVWNGVPQNNVGINTDVFDGYSKNIGILTAIRVMSPQIIICDEIGSEADYSAIKYAADSGVYVVASIHAQNISELQEKNINLNFFDSIVFLSSNDNFGHIESIHERTVNGYV